MANILIIGEDGELGLKASKVTCFILYYIILYANVYLCLFQVLISACKSVFFFGLQNVPEGEEEEEK